MIKTHKIFNHALDFYRSNPINDGHWYIKSQIYLFQGKKKHNFWIKHRISGHSTPHPHQHIKQVERRVSIHTHLTRTRALQWTQWEI